MVASNIEVAAGFPAAPDPEVRAVAKRRQFSAAYKLAVLTEAERLTEHGAIGALLRREGLYSSHLSVWRREREAGALEALGRRRGRKARSTPEERRIERLQARCVRLERVARFEFAEGQDGVGGLPLFEQGDALAFHA